MPYFLLLLKKIVVFDMITLGSIKIILQTAGISRLEISFDDELKVVNAVYLFRGKPGTKQITYQEVIDSLAIGPPGYTDPPRVDGSFELKDLPGENENNGLERM